MIDAAVTPALMALHQCAKHHLDMVGRPVCRFPIVFDGGNPPADACDCECGGADGQGWIRFAGLNAAETTGGGARCAPLRYDITLALGVYRCAPLPQGHASAVDEQVETEHALGMLVDATALRRAVWCCGYFDKHGLIPVIDHESAIGPSGGCVGVELRVTFQNSDCPCPSEARA